MDIAQACPIDRVPTKATAASDVAAIAMFFIRHRDYSLRSRRTAAAWLTLSAEIVLQMADIPYSRVEMKADLDDPTEKRRSQVSIRFVDVCGTLLRVSTSSGFPVVVQQPFGEALDGMKGTPVFKPEDEPLITVSVSLDTKRMRPDDCPVWLPALVSSWKLQIQTQEHSTICSPSQRSAPRL